MTGFTGSRSRNSRERYPGISSRQAGRMELEFLRHGSETRLGRQFVSYPFHMTRPFSLDPDIPELITLYQQSSSGGLYRAERLESSFTLEVGSACHVTTQSATVIHDCQDMPIN